MIEIGHTVTAIVNKINEDGCYCSLGTSGFGFMPKNLMDGLIGEDGNYLFSLRDRIEVCVYKISKNGFILLSSEKSYAVLQERQRERKEQIKEIMEKKEEKRKMYEERKAKIAIRESFAEQYEPGMVFEAEVVQVRKNKVVIRIGDIEGIIPKEEIDWNEINKLEDLLYEGEKVNVVFVEYDPGQKRLFFSLKYLKERPYEESYYDLDTPQLLSWMGHSSNTFAGVARSYGNRTFVENLYSYNDETKGKLLVDPIYGYNLRALVLNTNVDVEDGKCYKVKIKLISKEKRLERNQLFQFFCTSLEEVENPYQLDVHKAFIKRTTDPSANQTIAGLLKTVSKDMYSSKDRMFFELVQNADDASASKGVLIDVFTSGDYLVVCHNGYSFNKDDFEAITTAANGTKKANENKTGYKGIGFKSVFTDSEKVFISTGGYKFMFDRNEETFNDFDKFYIDNNPLIANVELKQKFLELYEPERRKFDKTNSIPWQLEPIWIDEFPNELGCDFSRSNVAIALKIGENKLSGENGYIAAINEIISSPIFMLFLRNTNRIDFNDKSISKSFRNNIITLKNSFNGKRVELFERVDFEIPVTNESFERNNVDIRIVVEEEDEGKITEAKFVDLKNQVFENIPKKIAITNATTLSFAVPINEDGTLNPICERTEISMFAFLPTLVKDFKFPFYLNANFILDPPRQRILGDNPWNFYLMREIAKNLVRWCATLSSRGDLNALNVLMPKYFEVDTLDTRQLAEHFNASYKEAIESESFIQNHNGVLSKQEEIILDKTGIGTKSSPLLSHILGEDLFCKILQTNKQLPNRRIKCSILSHKIFEKIQKIDPVEIIPYLVDNVLLKNWYIGAKIEEKDAFDKWISENNGLDVIYTLPIFSIDECWMSFLDIKKYNSLILLNDKLFPLRGLLEKLGYRCSVTTIEKCRFFDQIEPINEKALFETIISHPKVGDLSTAEKVGLIKMDFKDVGEKTIARVLLFRNQEGELAPLEKMVPYRDSAPTFLSRFMISKEEYNEELHPLLINPEDEFLKIVWPNITTIEESPINIINHYQLEGRYIQHFIKKCQNNEELSQLLSVVENADKVTRDCYLNQISRIDLNENVRYTKDSFEYRVLKMVIETREKPSLYSRKIFFQNRCLSDFTIDDKVKCDNVEMSLAKILPQFQNQSDTINKIKSLFDSFDNLDLFFVTSTIPLSQIANGLESPDSLQLRPGLWPLDKGGNAIQYLFYVYYYKKVKGYTSSYVISIELEKETDSFVFELMDFLFINELDIRTSPFTYRIVRYFSNKYFPSQFVLKDEELCSSIVKWADNGEKIEYLKRNGVRLESHPSIVLRKAFLQNQILDVEKLTKDNMIIRN